MVVVSNSIVDPSIATESNIGTDLDVGAELVLAVESVVDILIETKIEMWAKPGVIIAESVIAIDVVFDLTIKTDDMVYFLVSFIFVYYII